MEWSTLASDLSIKWLEIEKRQAYQTSGHDGKHSTCYRAARYQKSTYACGFLKKYCEKTNNKAAETDGHSISFGRHCVVLSALWHIRKLPVLSIALAVAREDWGSARTTASDGDKRGTRKRNEVGEQRDIKGVR